MHRIPAIVGVMAMAGLSASAQSTGPRLCEPWQSEYSGVDATSSYVIGLWQFKAGAETADSSPNGHKLQLQGATVSPNGRFGSCLESYRGWPDKDERHAAIAPNDSSLSPQGAFTLELWIKPKPDLEGYPDAFLLDKKYVAHDDYQMILSAASAQGLRRVRVNLGFGRDSATYTSNEAKFEPTAWYHLAFVYDGAGKGSFYLNGVAFGGAEIPGRKSISPGQHPLSIGDRIGSYYHGFPGFIDQVRISQGALEFRRAGFQFASDRTSFVRMEQPATLRFAVTNLQRTDLTGGLARVSVEGNEKQFPLAAIASGATQMIDYPLDTRLRPGEYQVKARIELAGDPPYASEEAFPVVIVPRPLPHRMPVLMWGIGSADEVMREMDRLKRIGFTHCLGLGADAAKIWDAGKPTDPDTPDGVAATKRMLNAALANGLSICAQLSPGSWARSKPELLRVGRDGKPYAKGTDICALFPQLNVFCTNVGASVAQAYGRFPAFDSANIHTEVRDDADCCFHDQDRAAFKQATGLDIPDQAAHKSGVPYTAINGFPPNRVVPDDYPLLRYYQWFWKAGDGWNGLNTAVAAGLRTIARKDFWCFHDPAVRVASVYGSGGGVDVLSQWTYSCPDPIRIGTATDELLCMAAGAPTPQRVMKMTQIIWYRSQTAPMSAASQQKTAARSPWEDQDPDAAFPTIAPMHLREAFWAKIARPIQGIMYHGWQSLVPTDSTGAYRYTHPETQHELTRLTHDIVQPLGPTLVQVPAAKTDVAFLESFSSEMFASRGTYGWGGSWAGDAYLVLQWAGLQPEIVFDETIVKRGLDGYKVLVMMDCDVLTRTVADKVKAFQKAGGIVVGDDHLCPEIKPDIVIAPYARKNKADTDKAALQTLAAQLRKDLGTRYTRYVDSSNPDVVTHSRRFGTTDYVFAINDHREFGTYVGRYGLVMENGLPSDATLTINRPSGFVYDVVSGRPVPAKPVGGRLKIDLSLEPCDGRLLMITDREIDAVRVAGPETAKTGDSVTWTVSVVDKLGQPIDAIVPLRVDVLDPDGRGAEGSGFYGAPNGRQDLRLDLAPNDVNGMWEVRVRELGSGQVARRYVRVQW